MKAICHSGSTTLYLNISEARNLFNLLRVAKCKGLQTAITWKRFSIELMIEN